MVIIKSTLCNAHVIMTGSHLSNDLARQKRACPFFFVCAQPFSSPSIFQSSQSVGLYEAPSAWMLSPCAQAHLHTKKWLQLWVPLSVLPTGEARRMARKNVTAWAGMKVFVVGGLDGGRALPRDKPRFIPLSAFVFKPSIVTRQRKKRKL